MEPHRGITPRLLVYETRPCAYVRQNGGKGRIRTSNQLLVGQPLYVLSYFPVRPQGPVSPPR